MSDTNCPNCGASAWYRAGDGTKNYDCGSSSLSSNPSELCQTRRERDEARGDFKHWHDAWIRLRDEKEKCLAELEAQNAKLQDIAEWFANAWYENGSDEGWQFRIDKKARRLFKELKQIKEEVK